jgi:hypothetical protein
LSTQNAETKPGCFPNTGKYNTPELDSELLELKTDFTKKLSAIREKYFSDPDGVMITTHLAHEKFAVNFVVDMGEIKE